MDKYDRMIELLEKILCVMAIQVGEGKGMTERARLLKMAGLDNITIAKVLDTTTATVRSVTSNLRKKR